MKTVSSLALTTLLAGLFAATAPAQEENFLFPSFPAAPMTTTEEEEPVPQKIEIPGDAIESSARETGENPLLPNSLPEPAAPTRPPLPPKRGTAEQLRTTARIRELKTRLQNDPELNAQLEQERRAKTFEGRRTAMRNYYTLLYKKIARLDPSVEKAAMQQLYRKLSAMKQNRIRPAVLIEDIKKVPGSSLEELQPPR